MDRTAVAWTCTQIRTHAHKVTQELLHHDVWKGYNTLHLSPLPYLSLVLFSLFNLPEGTRIAVELGGIYGMAAGDEQVSLLDMTDQHSAEVSKPPFTDVGC